MRLDSLPPDTTIRPAPTSKRVGGYLLRMFGAMVLEGQNKHQVKFKTKRSALILARLAVARDQRIGRDELAELLWPDEYLDQTRLRLRQEILRLRQASGDFGQHLLSDRQWVWVESGYLKTDAGLFDYALELAAGDDNLQSRIDHLSEGLSLISGPFLAGHQDPWIQATRRTYHEKIRLGWLNLADAFTQTNQLLKALDAANCSVRHDPLDTYSNTMLIQKLLELGRTAQANEAFQEFDRILLRELGHPAPNSVKDLLPKRPTVLAPDGLPPSDTASSGFPRPPKLFGREELVERILATLGHKRASVIVAGSIGVGKTHLIHEIAWRLASTNDLPLQIAGQPLQVSDGLYLVDPKLATDEKGKTIELALKNGWRVICESGSRLGIDRMQEYVVNPLDTPSLYEPAETVYSNPSIQLLASQMSTVGTPWSSASEAIYIAEIARQVDGLPSALKAISSLLTVETPKQVLDRMDSVLSRFSEEADADGESIKDFTESAILGLSHQERHAFFALSAMDGALVDLALELSKASQCPDVWHQLEKRCLIVVDGLDVTRRFYIPKPIAAVIRGLAPPAEYDAVQRTAWQVLADWAYALSRKLVGPNVSDPFTALASELENLRRGLTWAIDHDSKLAAYLVISTWRTVCARGHPALDGDLLYRAAILGANHLAPILGGETWTGAAITLSMSGQFERAAHAYHEATRIFKDGGHDSSAAWAQLNYAVCVLVYTDKQLAIDTLKTIVDEAVSPDLQILAKTDYALALASTGVIAEPIRVAEEIFSQRLLADDVTMHARAYVDLGELYHVAGRREAARPLTKEGIRRLREAGIQYMLLDQLIYLAQVIIEDDHPQWEELEDALTEASGIALKMGDKSKQLKVARIRLEQMSRVGSRPSFLGAIESMFHLTQSSQLVIERERSLQLLAQELERHEKLPYANSIRAALGESSATPCHEGWKSILSTDSHETLCVLAVVLAKEALAEQAKP